MKTIKKIFAIVMAMLMVLSTIGCTKKASNNKDNNSLNKTESKVQYDPEYDNGGEVVELKFWHSGNGIAYMEEIIQTFNMKQSDWLVKIDSSSAADALRTTLGLSDIDTTDVYMIGPVYDQTDLEPLEELLDSKADGDSKTLREKFNSNYLETEKTKDGKIYTLTTGGGLIGFIYNTKLFEKAGLTQAPRTSDELEIACEKLKEVGVTPFIHFSGGGYWQYFYETWQAQYDGFDYYMNNFYACKDEQGNSPSKSVFTKKDGRYYTLKALSKIVTPENVAAGSSGLDHVSAQTMFIHTDIAMMVNGAWITNEMASVGNMDDFSTMRTPVISSIKNNLKTVKSEMVLRELITAIDNVTDGNKDISEYKSGDNYVVDGKEISAADWDIVWDARHTVATAYHGQSVCIPKYSSQKEGAKEFLKFVYSDEGYKIFVKHTHTTLPMELSEGELDRNGWNKLDMQTSSITMNAKHMVDKQMKCKHDIFLNGGATAYPETGNNYFLLSFCSHNSSDRKTAEEVWKDILNNVDSRYEQWIMNVK